MRCEPWGPDCGEPAAARLWALCCGRSVALCYDHLWAAEREIRAVPALRCLACGEDYRPGTWVVEPVDEPFA